MVNPTILTRVRSLMMMWRMESGAFAGPTTTFKKASSKITNCMGMVGQFIKMGLTI